MERIMNPENQKVNLSAVVKAIDRLFKVKKLKKDPSMSRFIPVVYDDIGFDWRNFFEPDFVHRGNGLMIRGARKIENVFLGVFPSREFLSRVFEKAKAGDMVFLHHPINMECGDPRGKKGRGFLPVPPVLLREIKNRDISVYACHAPMDYNTGIGTNEAMVRAFHGKVIGYFDEYGNGYAGRVCEITPVSTDHLIKIAKEKFHLPYVEFVGHKVDRVSKIGILAGGGGSLDYLQEMERLGVQCGIAGEVTNKIDSEWGRKEQGTIYEFLKQTRIGFIGLSHAGSEFLVMESQMKSWFKKNLHLHAYPIPEDTWWR
jgi:putative NIF3 family GTP cyclohydrolase 1 type 2